MSDRQQPALIAFILLASTLLCLAILGVGAYLLIPTNVSAPESATPLDPELNTALHNQGLLITYVTPNSPAAQAGLQRGYIILRVNETAVDTPSLLRDTLQGFIGETIDLQLLIGNTLQTVPITLGQDATLGLQVLASGEAALSPPTNPDPPNLPPALPELPPIVVGPPQVSSPVPDSPAAEAGLEEGDVITAVDGNAILSPQELQDSINSYTAGDTITLTIRRGDETLTRQATLGISPQDETRPFLGVNLVSDQQ